MLASNATWRWGGRRHCGCWRVWTSHWTTWPPPAAAGGCTQRVSLIPPRTPRCSWLRMSTKHTQRGLLETNGSCTLPPSQSAGLWCNYTQTADSLNDDGGNQSRHSLDFCKPETLECLCRCWCWTNFLKATWVIRERSQSAKDEGFKKTKTTHKGAATVESSHRSASFPEKTEGLGSRARGRTWTKTRTSAGFCRITSSSCRNTDRSCVVILQL